MPLLSRVASFLRNLIHKKRVERELGEEIDSYFEMLIEQKLGQGMNPAEARRAALIELDGRQQLKERTKEVKMGFYLETLWQDLRYGLRGMRRNPGFVLVAVLTLGLGIGANTAIFSLIDKLMLESLPVERPRELVMLNPEGLRNGWASGAMTWSYPAFVEMREQQKVFSGMLAVRTISVNLMIGGATERATETIVSGDYFETLGVRAMLGRVFTREEEQHRDGSPVAVISHGFWVERFGGRPEVIGQTIRLNGNPFTIIGVTERGFNGLEIGGNVDLFVPVSMLRQVATYGGAFDNRTAYIFDIYARLKPGLGREQAVEQLLPIYRAMLELDVAAMGPNAPTNDQWRQARMTLEDGHRGTSELRENLGTPLAALLAMTGVVMLIACANLAGLLMARAAARTREISIRLAIGAARGRIVRQLLTESLLLAALGGVAGLIVAKFTINLLAAGMVDNAARLQQATGFLDRRVLGFALAATAATGLLFGLLPALSASREHLASNLRTGGGGDRKGQARLRKTLVTAQIALGLLLVTASGLFMRTLYNLRHTETGFRTERLIQFTLNSGQAGYDRARSLRLFEQLLDDLRAIPGVSDATLGIAPVLSNSRIGFGMEILGYTPRDSNNGPQAFGDAVAPGYLAMLGTPLLLGRDFTKADTPTSTRVVIVNEAFVTEYFPNQNPLGQKLIFGWGQGRFAFEIVGVSKNARMSNLRDEPRRNFFMPYTQWDVLSDAVFYVRSAGDPATLSGSIRNLIKRYDSNLPLVEYRTVEEQIDHLLRPERMVASLSLAFGLLATGLAAIGLYGVTSFTVARQTREIGVRMALGAQRGAIVQMVLGDILKTTALGVGAGAALSLPLARYIESQLYGVAARDLLTLGAAALTLALVALAAGWLPARRASRVDPMVALRQE